MAHPRKYVVLKPFELGGQKYEVGVPFPADREVDLNAPAMDREIQVRIERGFIERARGKAAPVPAARRGK